jgi:hypothetical protein
MLRPSLLPLALALLGACGCAERQVALPYPPVGPQDDASVERVLRTRSPAPRSVYAVLGITYEGPEVNGTFSTVMHHVAPRWFRYTAFKDLIVMAHDIFDLALRPDGYAARYAPDDEGDPELFTGPLAELAASHPRFSGFHWAGEAFFLPGALAEEPPRVVRGADQVRVESTLRSGVPVTWHLDPETLTVLAATLRPAGAGPVRLEYSDYATVAGRVMAQRVRYQDPRLGTDIVALLEELEVDPELDLDLFRLDGEPR